MLRVLPLAHRAASFTAGASLRLWRKRSKVLNGSDELLNILINLLRSEAYFADRGMIPSLVNLEVDLTLLTSLTALATSIVTVPLLGLGINPRGPRIRPIGPILPMQEGIVMITSTSVQPPFDLLDIFVKTYIVAPASLAAAPDQEYRVRARE